MKYFFYNDYSDGGHPDILKYLSSTHLDQESGYGEDSICEEARNFLKKKLNNENVDIHFTSGGTQANLIILAALTKSYESIISVDSAHINVHEAGAIELTGRKINIIPNKEGKLSPKLIDPILKSHNMEHMVVPKVVFISNATELGTIYKKNELKELYDYCQEHNLYLYLDGARLGSALMSDESDLSLADICDYCDVFYIGGTKNGAMLGEAVVIVNDDLKPNFRHYLKQRGALLAKGRILGAQFLCLFENNLFFELADHANKMARLLTNGIKEAGFKFLAESSTNQIFPILPKQVIKELEDLYGFYIWEEVNESESCIRLVTSWATKEEKVKDFLNKLTKSS